MTLGGLDDGTVARILSDPDLLRLLESPLGEFVPVARSGTSMIVTRFADVVEVLERDECFRVGEIYGPAMARTIGDFVLGMDESPRYEREVGFLRSAVHAIDADRIRTIAANEADDLLERALAAGRIDLASGYAHKIALAVVSEYFGVTGPDEETLGQWLRGIFWDIFLNVTRRPDVTQAAVRYAAELNAYLDARIGAIRSAFERTEQVPDHFLGRLVLNQRAHGIDDAGVRRNIAGAVVGTADTISKTIVNAIDQLMSRPAHLAGARRAAEAEDREALHAYAFEALRFNPNNSILIRFCAKADCVLARGTDRETLVPKGGKVYASVLSAMFDGSVLSDPKEFRLNRPWQHYLHFGRGRHRCFGEGFSRICVPQAIASLLKRARLRRAPEPRGRIRYEGPFPEHLIVHLESKI